MRCFDTKFRSGVPPSSISLISRQNNAKHHRHYFDGCFATLANPADCRFCESQNLVCLAVIARSRDFVKSCKFVAIQNSPPPLRKIPHPKPLPQGEGLSLSPPPKCARGIKGVGKIILDSANPKT
ncbi:hypothetical protein [Helicobacter sp. 23-1045]